MKKVIISDILFAFITLFVLAINIILEQNIHVAARNFFSLSNKDACLKNNNVICINKSLSNDFPLFVKRDYETYPNNEYLCLIEFILNDGEVYSFSFSGTTDDDYYSGLNSLSNITLLCQNNIQSSSLVKELTADEIEKLSKSIDSVDDTQSQEYAVLDDQNASHYIDIWGFAPRNNSLILYYSFKKNTASVCADKNAQQVLSVLLTLFN